MDEEINQFIKVHHQDGLIYFSDFRIADVLLVKKDADTYRLDIDVKTYDGRLSEEEVSNLENRFNTKINNEQTYAWLSLKNKQIVMSSVEEIETLEFEQERGWNENDDEQAYMYFGWAIELKNNIVKIYKENGNIFLSWNASSDDVDYYDSRAKGTSYEMKIKVRIVELQDENEIDLRWRKLANKQDRYYEIIRNMIGRPMPNGDLNVHEKITDELRRSHSKLAWKLVPEIMEKFPKKKSY